MERCGKCGGKMETEREWDETLKNECLQCGMVEYKGKPGRMGIAFGSGITASMSWPPEGRVLIRR